MDKIIGVIGGVPGQATSRNDDDFTDRLSRRYTTALLVVFAIIVSTKQYVGEPINCWVPAHFTGNHEEYTNNYCWIRNTYYLPFEEQYIPREDESRHMIPYYQWMPMILLVQALLFYLPCMVWRTLNGRSGIDVNNIVESGETFQNIEMAEMRDKTLSYMTKQMDRYLTAQKEYKPGCTISLKHCLSRTCCFFCGRRKGNYLSVLYIMVKVLYIANVVGQIFALNAFLGHDYNMYGLDVISSLASGEDWTQSSRFPRVTMCDFKVRRLGNVQRYTVQCVLPINLFNEKIYLCLWFWMVFVATMTCLSLVTWMMRSIFKTDRHRYVKKHLRLMDKIDRDTDKKNAARFVEQYLRQDGVFVLRLVGHNTNAITVTEFVCSLWDHFRAKPVVDHPDEPNDG